MLITLLIIILSIDRKILLDFIETREMSDTFVVICNALCIVLHSFVSFGISNNTLS